MRVTIADSDFSWIRFVYYLSCTNLKCSPIKKNLLQLLETLNTRWNILQTRNVLDCEQSNYSSRIIFSYTFTLDQIRIWSDEPFQRYGHSKYRRRLTAAILDLVQPEVASFDPPTSKTLPWKQTWSGSDDPLPRYGHSKFSKMRGRSVVDRSSVVGRSSVLNIYIVLKTLQVIFAVKSVKYVCVSAERTIID